MIIFGIMGLCRDILLRIVVIKTLPLYMEETNHALPCPRIYWGTFMAWTWRALRALDLWLNPLVGAVLHPLWPIHSCIVCSLCAYFLQIYLCANWICRTYVWKVCCACILLQLT